jgi:hypothetical protein
MVELWFKNKVVQVKTSIRPTPTFAAAFPHALRDPRYATHIRTRTVSMAGLMRAATPNKIVTKKRIGL